MNQEARRVEPDRQPNSEAPTKQREEIDANHHTWSIQP
jgi:hypothetical protein